MALRQIVETDPTTEAIFCTNDLLEIGVMFEAQRKGIRIPDRVAVMGFSDLGIAAISVPPLTTVRVDPPNIGRIATVRCRLGQPRAQPLLFDIFRLFADGTQDVAVGAYVAAESFLAEPAVEPAPREKGPIRCDFEDGAATRDPSGRSFALTVINRHRHDGLRLKLELGQAAAAGSGTLHVVRAEAPDGGDPAGNGISVYTETRQVDPADGRVDLPPASVAFLSLGEG